MGTRPFGPEATAEDVVADLDLGDRVAVVTGASSGIGAEVTRVLKAAGATVVATGRDAAGLDGDLNVALDLASLDSVRAAAAEIASGFDRIDLLFDNAGVMATPEARTTEGFELQLGTNHLGHFLLTARLVPVLAPGARVVVTSSLGHVGSGMRWEDPHYRSSPYEKWEAYGQSKSANVLFAKGLATRGIVAYAVHPGAIETGLTRHLGGEELQFVQQVSQPMLKSVGQGAATLLWAATADGIENGSYLADCAVAEPAPHATDPTEVDRLWVWSEEQVGEPFPA